MAKLIYSVITSLDGYVADRDGDFHWAAPDEEVHRFVNDLERPIGTYLYGRRMYEVMVFWEDERALSDPTPVGQAFGRIWRAADKVVYSRTLETVSSVRTRLERSFDPAALREWKRRPGRDISVGGPGLAAQAIRAGVVDEYHLLVTPSWSAGHACASGRRPVRARAGRRAALRERRGAPPLPHEELRAALARQSDTAVG